MDKEPEVIRREMEETRHCLSEKLETLERRVIDTVQSATTAAGDTVASVKEAVQETMDSARESMHETVTTVKNAFDVRRQVSFHPWAMMGGAAALGFLGGRLLTHHSNGATNNSGNWPAGSPRSDGQQSLATSRHLSFEEKPAAQAPSPSGPELSRPSWLDELSQKFDTEITQLKQLAIGAAMGAVRDMVSESVPPPMGAELAEIIDNATAKVGGKRLPGPLFKRSPEGRAL